MSTVRPRGLVLCGQCLQLLAERRVDPAATPVPAAQFRPPPAQVKAARWWAYAKAAWHAGQWERIRPLVPEPERALVDFLEVQ